MSPALSRAAALGLLAIVLALGWVLVVEPYRAMIAGQEAGLAERAERLERYTRMAAATPELTLALEAADSRPAAGNSHLTGTSDALAAAALHGRIGRIAEGSGVSVLSVEPVPATEAQDAGRIALAIAASGPLDGVQRLLVAIETGRPLLFVEELELTNPSVTGTRMASSGQPIVNVRLRIAGYRGAS